MSNALVPFERAQLPADLAALFSAVGDDDLSGGVGIGFPSLSIKGKVFHLKRGGEKTLITNPADHETPAAALDVVILKANPNLSKQYYESGYVEGSDDKPTCYSDDGVAPAADAESPQAQRCATCPHAIWGSKITQDGKKSKECQDSRRIAVAPLGDLNDAMLLRVPAASLKPLKLYGDEIKRRGLKYFAIGTRIGFDYSVAHPLLTYKPLGALPETMLRQVAAMINSELVTAILGMSPEVQDEFTAPLATPPAEPQVPAVPPAAKAVPKPAKTPVARTAVAAAAAPKPAGGFTASFAVEDATPAEPAQPAQKAPVKAAPKVKPAPAALEVADDLDSQLDAMLNAAGFEDEPAE